MDAHLKQRTQCVFSACFPVVDLCINHHLWPEEASALKHETCSNLWVER